MIKFYRRLDFRYSILLCCLLVLIGCGSHRVPYYSPTVLDAQKGDVKKLPAQIKYRVILLGDGGAPKKDEPVLETLGKWAGKLPKKSSIVFLGDNMYPDGLTKKDSDKADDLLGPQLDVVITSQACGVFIPGNHDWEKGGKYGHSTVVMQEHFINKRLGAQSRCNHPPFLPERGDPGPISLELPAAAPVARLIVLDTQWWLHEHQKPHRDLQAIIADLKAQLITELPVIIAGHHPIETHGPHGGHRDWKSVDSLWHFVAWHLLSSQQNINGNNYKDMVNHLNQAFSVPGPGKTPLLIYAAGHEHSLQVLKGTTTDYLLVSGAASSQKISEVTNGDNTLFAHAHTGFMVVDFLKNDAVLLRVVEPGNKEVLFHHWLR